MSVLHLQSLLGHSSLEMTRRYVSIVGEDLGEAHKEYGPIDRFLKSLDYRYYSLETYNSCPQPEGAIVCSIEVQPKVA
jgi:hypothetical protein